MCKGGCFSSRLAPRHLKEYNSKYSLQFNGSIARTNVPSRDSRWLQRKITGRYGVAIGRHAFGKVENLIAVGFVAAKKFY